MLQRHISTKMKLMPYSPVQIKLFHQTKTLLRHSQIWKFPKIAVYIDSLS